jgi:hypothetical protein
MHDTEMILKCVMIPPHDNDISRYLLACKQHAHSTCVWLTMLHRPVPAAPYSRALHVSNGVAQHRALVLLCREPLNTLYAQQTVAPTDIQTRLSALGA